MYEVKCGCGNEACHNEIDMRRGMVFFSDHEECNWLHIHVTNMEGKSMELMINPDEAKDMARWMKKQYLYPKWVYRLVDWAHRIH